MKTDPKARQRARRLVAKRSERKESGRSTRKVSQSFWATLPAQSTIRPRRQFLPAWVVPLAAFLLLAGLIFWLGPRLLRGWQRAITPVPTQTSAAVPAYGSEWRVILPPAADVFAEADIKATRLTQALCNEPVRSLASADSSGYTRVRTLDGAEGFVRSADLAPAGASVDEAQFEWRITVVSPVKRIMSHARDGALITEVFMGTVLYADYRGDGLSRVVLPDGQHGWANDEGLLIQKTQTAMELPEEGAKAFAATATQFLSATYLDGGVTLRGTSGAGVAFVAGRINGLELPRLPADLAQAGREVSLNRPDDSQKLDPEQFNPGDLVIYADAGEPGVAKRVGVVLETGKILYARPGNSSLRLIDLRTTPELLENILSVRRLFQTG